MTQLILAVNLRGVSRQIPSSEFVDSKVLYSYLLVAQSEGPLSYIFEPELGSPIADEQIQRAWPEQGCGPFSIMELIRFPGLAIED